MSLPLLHPVPSAGTSDFDPRPGPLLDPQGRLITYLRLSVTDRCNLRCLYCSPSHWEGRAALASADELERLVRVFASLGIRRLRLTGGEPLLRDDLIDIVERVRSTGITDIALTTNGMRLAELAPELLRAGVGSVNVSLDSMDPGVFRHLAGGKGEVSRVWDGLMRAIDVGFARISVNTVVVGGVNDDAPGLARLTRAVLDRGAVLRFIERMPFAGAEPAVATSEVMSRLRSQGLELHPGDRRAGAGPAVYATVHEEGQRLGEVGFIGAITENFCAGCNRIRLSSAGRIRACLGGTEEAPLLDRLRAGASDNTLRQTIRAALGRKHDGHRFVAQGGQGLLSMMGIGG